MQDLFPAYAGVILHCCCVFDVVIAFPRIRGGDPNAQLYNAVVNSFSPHTRG